MLPDQGAFKIELAQFAHNQIIDLGRRRSIDDVKIGFLAHLGIHPAGDLAIRRIARKHVKHNADAIAKRVDLWIGDVVVAIEADALGVFVKSGEHPFFISCVLQKTVEDVVTKDMLDFVQSIVPLVVDIIAWACDARVRRRSCTHAACRQRVPNNVVQHIFRDDHDIVGACHRVNFGHTRDVCCQVRRACVVGLRDMG